MDICTCFSHLLSDLHSLPLPLLLITLTGLLTLLRLPLLLRFLYTTFLRAPKALLRYGSHAVITGATDGIGKAFAFQLARQRLHLILIGRSADKLHTVSQEIVTKYPNTKIQTVVIDFSQDLVSGVERLKEVISGVDVGVLVNNAGVSYPYARFFHEVDEELLMNLVKVNVEGVTRVTQAVLPGMIERKRGAIVNIGSGTATVIPTEPLYAVYAATKAYIDQFSRCLYVEYKNKGIDVQCQVPLYVATKMSSIRRSTFFALSADAYARSALRWIGYEPRCTPYWPHSVQWCLLSMLPESVIDNWRLNFCIGVRKRGQLKDAKKREQ